MTDSDQLRVCYEGVVKQNSSDVEAVRYLAVWHLERQSYQQARKYFGHLATIKTEDPDVWLCLSISCAMVSYYNNSILFFCICLTYIILYKIIYIFIILIY